MGKGVEKGVFRGNRACRFCRISKLIQTHGLSSMSTVLVQDHFMSNHDTDHQVQFPTITVVMMSPHLSPSEGSPSALDAEAVVMSHLWGEGGTERRIATESSPHRIQLRAYRERLVSKTKNVARNA